MTRERIQKVIANAGLASRRGGEEMVRAGRVTVDGRRAIIGEQVDPGMQQVEVDGNPLPAIDYARAAFKQPVTVTFHFRGATPPPGGAFYLWGDFLGSKTFAVRLPRDGAFTTTMMPGSNIRFQVFDLRISQNVAHL